MENSVGVCRPGEEDGDACSCKGEEYYVVVTITPALGKKQDCHEFKASLNYTVILRITCVT